MQSVRVFYPGRTTKALDSEVPRGEKMLYFGTDPESCITENTLVYEDILVWALTKA